VPTCIDNPGTVRQDGETWSITYDFDYKFPCPDSYDRLQRMRKKVIYLCKDTKIRQIDVSLEPLSDLKECPAPSIKSSVTPKVPHEGSTADYKIETDYVKTVSYVCKEADTNNVVKQGNVNPGEAHVPLTVYKDMYCDALAVNSFNVQMPSHVDIPVDCGNKLKVGGKCVDFTCKTVKPLVWSNGKLEVPARTEEGVCYAVKLLNAVAGSESKLTKVNDGDLVSRNHDVRYDDPNDVRHPYLLGKKQVSFWMGGARTVKLAGSPSPSAPIKVDNFIMVGIAPQSVANPGAEYYKAYGTSDSTVYTSNSIIYKNKYVPLQAFATGGTSTITPLDITSKVTPNQVYNLDVRAEDCGAWRELSDIYLLFQ
jgi:hypothetical protein